MTEDSLPREPTVGFVQLGKQTMLDAMAAAGKHGILTMIALLWYADNDTGNCHPSMSALAARAGLQLRTLREALGKLRAAEVIAWEDRSALGKPHVFTINQTIHTKKTFSSGVPGRPSGPPSENGIGVERKRSGGGRAKTLPELDSATTTLRTSKDTLSESLADFAEFWNAYGRKDTSRKLAKQAWMTAAKQDMLPEQSKLLDQVQRYRLHTFKGRSEEQAGKFLLHPVRWINRQCYDSEYPDTYQGGPGSGGRLQPAYDPGEAGEEVKF